MARRNPVSPQEAEELQRLWRSYADSTARVLDIMRTKGTDRRALPMILAEDAKAGAAIKRIEEIVG
jgi:hypothetical protein